MTSEDERADTWWDEHFLMCHGKETIVKMLKEHAAEQRIECVKSIKNVCQHFNGQSFNPGHIVLLEDACLNAKGEE